MADVVEKVRVPDEDKSPEARELENAEALEFFKSPEFQAFGHAARRICAIGIVAVRNLRTQDGDSFSLEGELEPEAFECFDEAQILELTMAVIHANSLSGSDVRD
jgi:hypothetical protein